MNILKGQPRGAFDPGRLMEAASIALNEARGRASELVEGAVAEGDLDTAVGELLRLRKPIDSFFDEVMVMVEDEALRDARLGLLAEVRDLFLRVADFSLVVLEGEDRDEQQV
jgi:glycyl-tRNA synthetase beta chain